MLLSDLVATSNTVAATRSRLKKKAALKDCLLKANAADVDLVVHYLTGTLPQGKIGLGPSILRGLSADTENKTTPLLLTEVNSAFDRIANITGKGSQAARKQELGRLFERVTLDERDFLVRLILGELRQGALEAVFSESLADASAADEPSVRRAVMVSGNLAEVARAALFEGPDSLEKFRLTPLLPVQPMLAQPVESMTAAMESIETPALEYKLDGARVQIHKHGTEVRIYSRQLNDVTASLPEGVELASAIPAESVILDGEVIALRENGRPFPFQVTMRRFGRKTDVAKTRTTLPLSVFLFDCLLSDDKDLIDEPYSVRFDHLKGLVNEKSLVNRLVTNDVVAAKRFLDDALDEGHEGIMVKAMESTYAAGNRGSAWLKVKQAHTLDLVVLAAEWGSGRRRGWLSNLHLGALDSERGEFVMLGKTFKGLTDKLLAWQTEQLQALEIRRDGHVVYVRPELVVEIAVNEIQESPHYPAGMALRFARVKRYREDKTPDQADTLDTVRKLFKGSA